MMHYAIPDKSLCLHEIHRVLRPQGMLSIAEQPGDPDFTPRSDLKKLVEGQGFHFVESFGGGKNYTVNFKKM
jgi:ubiquinone/menaquinone biosynthesis C-methylase UbiE